MNTTRTSEPRLELISMTDFDSVKNIANISFIGAGGKQVSMWIHETTFKKLVSGSWDANELGQPTATQAQLKEAIKSYVGGNPVRWFTDSANAIMMRRTQGAK